MHTSLVRVFVIMGKAEKLGYVYAMTSYAAIKRNKSGL